MKLLFLPRRYKNTGQYLIPFCLAVLTFLFLFVSRLAQQKGDGLYSLITIKEGNYLIWSHHLLYTSWVKLFFILISPIFKTCDLICAAQIHNILLAIVEILSFYFLIRYLFRSTFMGLLAAMLLFTSRGFWEYSTLVETYIPSAACLAFVMAVLIICRNDYFKGIRPFMLIIALSMAVLYHQTAVLFFVPLCYYLISARNRRLWIIIFLSGVFTIFIYILIFTILNGKWDLYRFFRFCFAGAFSLYTDWGKCSHFNIIDLARNIYAQLLAIVYLPRRFSHIGVSIFTLLIASIFLWNIIHIIKRAAYYKFRVFCLIWLITYFLFFLWWSPGEPEFLSMALFPFFTLLFIVLYDIVSGLKKYNISRIIPVSITSLLISMFFILNYPHIAHLHRDKGLEYKEAYALNKYAPADSILFGGYNFRANARYHFNRKKFTGPDIVFMYFYQKLFPEIVSLSDKSIIIPFRYVVPSYNFYEFNGYRNPTQWQQFINWLFNLDYDSQNKLISFNKFEIVTDEGVSFVLVSPVKVKTDGLLSFFREIDNYASKNLGKRVNIFELWASKDSCLHQ
jgi:hypothetical protein